MPSVRKNTDKKKPAAAANYRKRREQVRDIQHAQRIAGRNISEIPRIKNTVRRRDCLADFELFCKTYYPGLFYLKWADYQKKTAERIQETIESGGWYARALPRGGGKTTLCKCGIAWAALRGQKRYSVIYAANESMAGRLLKSIKMQLLTNPLLYEDFPHTIHPIREAGGESNLAKGQLYKGQSTYMEWGASRIVLPWIDEEPSTANGCVIEAYGIEQASRGLSCDTPKGESLRPDLALVDDPQTRASAKSPPQTQTRLEHLTGDVAYLPGPDKSISVFCPCTVIYEGDLADQILNRETHPEWHGERTKFVEHFPKDLSPWDEYAEVLKTAQRDDGNIEAASAYYKANRKVLDRGFVITWPERYGRDKGEVSAIQHAMNARIRDEAAFFAEYQNEPILPQDEFELATADEICAKVTGHARGIVPDNCSVLTAFTDIQGEHFFWMVCGWAPDFTGYVIDYGAWPEQHRNYFTRQSIRRKLSSEYPGDRSGIIFAALTELGDKIAGTRYQKMSGGDLQVARWCLDIGWEGTPVTAYAVQSAYRNIISLTKGVFVGATTNPFSEAERAKKWRTTHGHWFWADGPGPAKAVRFDANHWKKRIHMALKRPTASMGAIQLFKANPQQHRMLADHLLAEKPTRVTAKNRTVDQFDLIPGHDNEGLDCLVGCAVGASIAGIVPDTERVHQAKSSTIKTPAEWMAEARARR